MLSGKISYGHFDFVVNLIMYENKEKKSNFNNSLTFCYVWKQNMCFCIMNYISWKDG